jgi:hypothetical protein
VAAFKLFAWWGYVRIHKDASPDTHTTYGWNSEAPDAPQWPKWLKFYAGFEIYAKYSHVDAMHAVRSQYCFATTACGEWAPSALTQSVMSDH